jgi:hypothetical protein
VVNNNLQRRAVKAPSNRVGLENIKAKYELLKQKGFQIMEDGKNLPLFCLSSGTMPMENRNAMMKETKTT